MGIFYQYVKVLTFFISIHVQDFLNFHHTRTQHKERQQQRQKQQQQKTAQHSTEGHEPLDEVTDGEFTFALLCQHRGCVSEKPRAKRRKSEWVKLKLSVSRSKPKSIITNDKVFNTRRMRQKKKKAQRKMIRITHFLMLITNRF